MEKEGGDQEIRIKRVKRALEGWREAVILSESVLLWDCPWFAPAVLAASTTIFLFIWALEPSVLTAFSVLGLIWCLLDYCGAAASTALLRNAVGPWTAIQERKLDELCRSLVLQYTHATTAFASFRLLRTVRPRAFYAALGTALLALAWLGSAVHNLLLTYVLITGLLLMPGLRKRGIFAPYTRQLSAKFNYLLHNHRKEQ